MGIEILAWAGVPQCTPNIRDDLGVTYTLQWLAGQAPVAIEDESTLSDALASAERDAATAPLIAELRSSSGAALTIGLGREVSVATFAATLDPPYFVSRGETGRQEPLVFFRDGHWSEFDGGAAIPPASARNAVHEFFATGARPSSVAWSEV
jgi:hypothetical protein